MKSSRDITQFLEYVSVMSSTLSFSMPKPGKWFIFIHAMYFPAQKLWWTVFLKYQPYWLPSQMRH